MKLSKKILIGYCLISLILILSILLHGFTRFVFFEDSRESRAIANEIDVIDTFAISIFQLLMPANDYLITGDRRESEKYENLFNDAKLKLQSVRAELGPDHTIVSTLEENIEEIDKISREIFRVPIRNTGISTASSLMYKMDQTGVRMYEIIKKYDELHHKRLEEINIKSARNIKLVNLFTAGTWALLLCLAFIIMYFFNNDIKKPIEKLSRGFQGVSHGRWSYVNLTRNDELGDLAREFNSMVDRLGSSYEDLENEVRNRTRELNELNNRLESMAITDGLTNVYNHRYFYEKYQEEFNRTVRYDRHLAILMIDIDFFKKFNDTHGHQTGDLAIQNVAKILKNESRKTDTVARYGGEEFVIICPEMNSANGLLFAQRLIKQVRETPVITPDQSIIGSVTISIGIAVYPDVKTDAETLLRKADEALYQAKEGGRNQVILYAAKV